MSLYEMRIYTLQSDAMDEAVQLYKEQGWPVLEKSQLGAEPVGCFTTTDGTVNKLVHLWKFDDEAARRMYWRGIFENQDFLDFLGQIRPLLRSQEIHLLNEAPWGPHP